MRGRRLGGEGHRLRATATERVGRRRMWKPFVRRRAAAEQPGSLRPHLLGRRPAQPAAPPVPPAPAPRMEPGDGLGGTWTAPDGAEIKPGSRAAVAPSAVAQPVAPEPIDVSLADPGVVNPPAAVVNPPASAPPAGSVIEPGMQPATAPGASFKPTKLDRANAEARSSLPLDGDANGFALTGEVAGAGAPSAAAQRAANARGDGTMEMFAPAEVASSAPTALDRANAAAREAAGAAQLQQLQPVSTAGATVSKLETVGAGVAENATTGTRTALQEAERVAAAAAERRAAAETAAEASIASGKVAKIRAAQAEANAAKIEHEKALAALAKEREARSTENTSPASGEGAVVKSSLTTEPKAAAQSTVNAPVQGGNAPVQGGKPAQRMSKAVERAMVRPDAPKRTRAPDRVKAFLEEIRVEQENDPFLLDPQLKVSADGKTVFYHNMSRSELAELAEISPRHRKAIEADLARRNKAPLFEEGDDVARVLEDEDAVTRALQKKYGEEIVEVEEQWFEPRTNADGSEEMVRVSRAEGEASETAFVKLRVKDMRWSALTGEDVNLLADLFGSPAARAEARARQMAEVAADESNYASAATLMELFEKGFLKLPAVSREGEMSGEVKALLEELGSAGGSRVARMKFSSRSVRGMDALVEKMQGLGFPVRDQSEALDMIRRAFRGEEIIPQRGMTDAILREGRTNSGGVGGGRELFDVEPGALPTKESPSFRATEKAVGGRAAWERARRSGTGGGNLIYRQWVQVQTPEFKKWFGDWETDPANASKVVDAHGWPKVVYHGTPAGGFDVFHPRPTYFTDSQEVANVYRSKSASSLRPGKKPGTPETYGVFLNVRRPFDTRKPEDAAKFNEEFFGKGGETWASNMNPLSERGVPGWVDGEDIAGWIEETGQPFDAVILDEGGVPLPNGGAKWRGFSWMIPHPSGETVKSATNNSGAFSRDNPSILFDVEPAAGGKKPMADGQSNKGWKKAGRAVAKDSSASEPGRGTELDADGEPVAGQGTPEWQTVKVGDYLAAALPILPESGAALPPAPTGSREAMLDSVVRMLESGSVTDPLGRVIKLDVPDVYSGGGKSLLGRAEHLLFGTQDVPAGASKLEHFVTVMAVPETLKSPQLIGRHDGATYYIKRYEGGVFHAVVVRQNKVFSQMALVTQYPFRAFHRDVDPGAGGIWAGLKRATAGQIAAAVAATAAGQIAAAVAATASWPMAAVAWLVAAVAGGGG